ncbi:hypothetical protein [Mycobacterium sp. OTB74]|uniref:hypothetical protein n=1 Tax=Mycobacterium sp. OTB74 TaxID=1853452 RepID=UPI002474DA10|nr:hypothetical protein [Mycobacterium sp. OTB74]MDH6243224.1 hypothetical protein [Mycobacterium sp. OTB74]
MTSPASSPSTSPASPCPCGNPQDPQVVTNQPGLTTISDRVDDFTGFRRALLRSLPEEQALGPWRPVAGDLGLQFLEWWAYVADILTFYNERIAIESYLRTAQFPESIAGLVALLGYVPAPGLAATGVVGAIRTTKHPAEPVVIPDGMQLSSTPTPGVTAQTFEAAAATFPGPSDVSATTLPNPNLDVRANDAGPASVLLAGKVNGVKAGDQLLLVEKGWGGGNDNWAAVTIASTAPETDLNTGAVNTRVKFTDAAVWGTVKQSSILEQAVSGSIGGAIFTKVDPLFMKMSSAPSHAVSLASGSLSSKSLAMHSLAQSQIFSQTVFSNLSDVWWRGLVDFSVGQPESSGPKQATDYRLLKPTAATSMWSLTGGSKVNPSKPVENAANPVQVNLSTTVRSIQSGDLVFFDGRSQPGSVLGHVNKTVDKQGQTDFPEKVSPPAPDIIVIPYTQLTVETFDPGTLGGYASGDPVTVRYGYRDVGTVLPNAPLPLTALPTAVQVPDGFTLPLGVSQALLEDATGVGTIVQVAPNPTQDGTTQLTLSPLPPAQSTFNPALQVPLRLLFDVVSVSRGITVSHEVLGNGNAAVPNQRFTLQKSPLTYLAGGAGWAPALWVYVDGILWTEVPTLYNQPPRAQVYVVERSPDQKATIRFGDGVNGSRLTSGTGNVAAKYRYGSGAASPPAGRLTTMLSRQPNLASIHNPVPVSGGKDPQRPEDVKANAPASVFTFGRAISAIDYEVVAAQAAGVSRVKAYWTFDAAAQRTLVKLYINDDAGGVANAASALAGSDDPNRPVAVAPAAQIDVSVSATLVVAADRVVDDVVAAATAAFTDPDTGAFSPGAMGIGQWLYRSHVDAALSVPGVVAVHQLSVTWGNDSSLDEIADPGEGAYFSLPAANLKLTGVSHG